jgi:hypothetical protein
MTMSRALIVIKGHRDRLAAVSLIEKAPVGTRVEFKAAKRSMPQNDRMWAMLTDIAQQLPWDGEKLRPDDWKLMFMDALNRENQHIVRNIDKDGFVNLSTSSSDLSKGEMSDLLEIITEFGIRHGVKFKDEQVAA